MNDSSELCRYERLPTQVFGAIPEAVRAVANSISELIRERERQGKPAVLGLATGSTPVPLYRELIRMHREDGLSFRHVVTFNLDEYYPISADHPESYHRFMKEQLFDHIDIRPENIHIPNGMCAREDVFEKCREYEDAIRDAGGIDIQILGIGRTGHIGFNEPGSSLDSKTRLVTLDSLTRSDAAKDFLGESNVPRYAVTMGIGTILSVREIYLLAWGRAKAEILRKAIEQEPQESVPASFLQQHENVRVIADESAASELTRFKHPWLVSFPEWTPTLVRRAVSHLSLKLEKPLLKLVDKDYQENGLADLVTENGPAYSLNIRVFNEIQHTITGWPGGKPGTEDENRPERAEPAKKRVVVLSPEPSNDVIAMAGTINRLVAQGHDVSVVYLTSGSLGVPDEEASWAAELLSEAGEMQEDSLAATALRELDSKGPSDQDSRTVRRLKAIVRRNEARAALRICGVEKDAIHFLDLPFYENGKYRQFDPGPEDVGQLGTLLDEMQPHQIFFTGVTSDPSSVQSKAFEIMNRVIQEVAPDAWIRDCYFWEYHSGSREWEIDQIDMAVPCSPDELSGKIQSIYQHRSQMSQVPLRETERKEIWQHIQDRNRETANLFDQMGLAEYEAMECFRRWTSE